MHYQKKKEVGRVSIERATAYLKKYNKDKEIKEFNESSATVELAAKALNVKGQRIAKTLSFKVNDEVILIVTAGDAKISNSKYKEYFKTKAAMLKFEEVEPLVGHSVGGVCPFGINDGVKVYLDESLKRFETVFPACGSSNSAIELTIDELEKISNSCDWIDVCNIIE